MAYQAQDFSHLLGTPGFSTKLLENHFKLYEGYVKNTNHLMETFASAKSFQAPETAELKRRFGWEFNGMRLHEYYFGNLARSRHAPEEKSPLYKKISQEFGSFANWKKKFTEMGSIRGIGWVLLVYDPKGEALFNVWVNEHDTGHLAGCTPLLVLDVFEHAFMLDYGIQRDEYLKAFWNALHWTQVMQRYEAAQPFESYV